MSSPQQDKPADLVTQIQQQINRLCFLFFNDVGSLQRDAPPSSVRGEPVKATSNYDVDKTTAEMADQLAQAVPPLLGLIDRLPDVQQREEDAVKELAALQQQADALDEQLRSALQDAEAQLQDSQDVFGLLVQHQLDERHNKAGGREEGGGGVAQNGGD